MRGLRDERITHVIVVCIFDTFDRNLEIKTRFKKCLRRVVGRNLINISPSTSKL